MYVNNESEEINNISIKLLLFCIKKNIYIELKNRNTFNEYILNNTIHGFYIKKNKINIFMFQNKKDSPAESAIGSRASFELH